jgi:sugar O-acyltransferase (sialic acid O-acetyltransferase NeuD family)
MKNVLAIIGAGVLGQHIAHYAKLSGKFIDIVFFDDTIRTGTENNYGRVIGKVPDIDKNIKNGEIQNLLIGIGYKHMKIRKELYDAFCLQISFPNIIHNSCYVDESVQFGRGNVILPGCVIDRGCIIENNIFFNPGCIIAHDNCIGEHTFFAPGVKTSGFVRIGACCFFGTGTNLIDNITIGENIRTGAGTLITKSLTEPGTYKGIPGRLTK